MLRKSLILVIAVTTLLAIILLAAPLYTGKIAEERIHTLVEYHAGDIDIANIELMTYEQGWFKSTAKIGIEFKTDNTRTQYRQYLTAFGQRPSTWPHVTLHAEVYHGPLMFITKKSGLPLSFGLAYINYDLEFDPLIQGFIGLFTGNQFAISGHTRVSLLSNYDSALSSQGLYFGDERSQRGFYQWDGFSIAIALSRDMQSARIKQKLYPVTLKGLDFSFYLEEIRSEAVMRKSRSAFWLSDTTIRLPRIQWAAERAELSQLDLRQLRYQKKMKQNQEFVDIHSEIQWDLLTVNNSAYGPAIIHIDLQNLSAAAFAEWEVISSSAWLDFVDMTDIEYLHYLANRFSYFFTENSIVRVVMPSIAVPEGSIEFNGEFVLIQPVEILVATEEDWASTQEQLLANAQASLSLRVPVDTLQKVVTYLDNLADKSDNPSNKESLQDRLTRYLKLNYIVEHNNYYSVDMRYTPGEVIINGESITVDVQ